MPTGVGPNPRPQKASSQPSTSHPSRWNPPEPPRPPHPRCRPPPPPNRLLAPPPPAGGQSTWCPPAGHGARRRAFNPGQPAQWQQSRHAAAPLLLLPTAAGPAVLLALPRLCVLDYSPRSRPCGTRGWRGAAPLHRGRLGHKPSMAAPLGCEARTTRQAAALAGQAIAATHGNSRLGRPSIAATLCQGGCCTACCAGRTPGGVQHSTAQHNTAQHSPAQPSPAQRSLKAIWPSRISSSRSAPSSRSSVSS